MEYNGSLSKTADWQPKPSEGLTDLANEYGFPTVVYRTPSRLVEECEKAFDAGLLLASLNLAVTIPDVCAHIAESSYLEWCEKYLNLQNPGEKVAQEREEEKCQEDVSRGFEAISSHGFFTASDLYQLRCAVVHAGSSVIEGKGAIYSPYKAIGVCVQNDPYNLVVSYGHTASGVNILKDCAYDCVIRLEALISLMAKGVCMFLEENPNRDCEYSPKGRFMRSGIVDFRPLIK